MRTVGTRHVTQQIVVTAMVGDLSPTPGDNLENPCLNADEIKRLNRMPSVSAVAKACKINPKYRPVYSALFFREEMVYT